MLKKPTFRKTFVSGSAGGVTSDLALLTATYRPIAEKEPEGDCTTVSASLEQKIMLDPSDALQLVAAEVAANPNCACEIVKSAIHALEADPATVGNIVETASIAAPESIRLVSQCAIAVCPESLSAVQAVMAKLEPNRGERSPSAKSDSKDAKSAKDISAKAPIPLAVNLPNVLDRPVIEPPFGPPYFPPLVNPPPVTEED